MKSKKALHLRQQMQGFYMIGCTYYRLEYMLS